MREWEYDDSCSMGVLCSKKNQRNRLKDIVSNPSTKAETSSSSKKVRYIYLFQGGECSSTFKTLKVVE
jgi:hypothetical protein